MESTNSTKDPGRPQASATPHAVDYWTPTTAKEVRRGPGIRVWVALILYVLSLVTPTSVTHENGRIREVMMGWETAIAMFAWPRALWEGDKTALIYLIFGPMLNVLFMVAVALAFAASRRGARHVQFGTASRVLAGIAVPFAVIGLGLLLFLLAVERGFSTGRMVLVAPFPWIAAYLTLGLRWRWGAK